MTHPAFTPFTLGSLSIRNRIIKTATYEGMVTDGQPAETLVRHHAELARGGVGMTTVAYCAVSDEGRTFKNQMVMKDETVAPLRALTRAVHEEGAKAMLQLGHCGGFSKNEALGVRGPLGPSFGFNAYGALKGMVFTRAMSKDDIKRVTDDFRVAAVKAFEAGFDAIEVHVGHGYLLSQFISPVRNKRDDEYGGSLENRLRFPLEVIAAIRKELGKDAPIFAKMNLDDGVSRGMHVDDAVVCAGALERAGVSALVLSGGLVSHSALYLLRGERPLRAMIAVEENPLQKVALAAFGPVFVPKTPFEPLFFLPLARKVREAVACPLVYLGGATSLDHLEEVRREGFEMIAMGRALLHDPTLIEKYRRGEVVESGCTPCNLCITEMDRPGGVLCAKQPWQLERRAREVAEGGHLRVSSLAIEPTNLP
jgi:2,4-dienoyl-CoA reductase-like NADH-dependent reductase (Old Yellow Enzyme family)